MTSKKSWLNKLLLLLNILVIIALIISYFAPITDPTRNWLPSLMGLIFPVLFIINCLFIIIWIFRWKYFFLFSAITLLFGWNMFFRSVAFNGEKPVGAYDDALKVLSYNVRLFDQYKWTGNQNYFTRNSIFSLIENEDADIVCFQEFFHGNEKSFPTVEPFVDAQKAKYHHIDYVLSRGNNKNFGIATFSHYPIVNTGEIHFEGAHANSGIYTDILFRSDTIRIFNLHLESVRFSKHDYQFVSEYLDPGTYSGSGSRIILSKLKNAFIKRSNQASVIAGYIEKSPYPVIVCGDFNDTPASFAYRTICKNLNDTFLEIGHGVGSTYAGNLPFLRIDYLLHSDRLEPYHFEIQKVAYSDHYPISCFFKIK
nr:endonuclease/exonuclease/phosphatase family protein [Bacteroidota bacterium]